MAQLSSSSISQIENAKANFHSAKKAIEEEEKKIEAAKKERERLLQLLDQEEDNTKIRCGKRQLRKRFT